MDEPKLEPEDCRLVATVPRELHRAVKVRCAMKGQVVSDWIEGLVVAALAAEEEDAKVIQEG